MLSEEVFITVSQLSPASFRVNMRLKVAEVRVVGLSGGCRIAEVLVGDTTGVIGMFGNPVAARASDAS